LETPLYGKLLNKLGKVKRQEDDIVVLPTLRSRVHSVVVTLGGDALSTGPQMLAAAHLQWQVLGLMLAQFQATEASRKKGDCGQGRGKVGPSKTQKAIKAFNNRK
jgi:hypothetical protein